MFLEHENLISIVVFLKSGNHDAIRDVNVSLSRNPLQFVFARVWHLGANSSILHLQIQADKYKRNKFLPKGSALMMGF